MAMISAKDISTHGGNRSSRGTKMFGVFTTVYNATKKKMIVFIMAPALQVSARMTYGDKINVLYDPVTGEGLMEPYDKGWTLSTHKPQSFKGDRNLKVTIPNFPEWKFPDIPKTIELKVTSITQKGISFVVPLIDTKPKKRGRQN